MKLIEFFVELIYWVQIFLCPTLVLGFIGFVVYINNANITGITLFAILLIVGICLGIYFAERIRRTIGCSAFIGKIFSSDDVE